MNIPAIKNNKTITAALLLLGGIAISSLYLLYSFQNVTAASVATTYTADHSVLLRTTSAAPPSAPVVDPDGGRLSSSSFGNGYTCVISEDLKIYCSGDNDDYALGTGNQTDSLRPIQFGLGVAAFNTIKFIQVAGPSDSVFGGHTCGLTTDNKIYCSGRNPNGELATGDFNTRPSPALFGDGTRLFTQVAGGNNFTCALTTDNKIFCAGENDDGQLGANLPAGNYNTLRQFGGSLVPAKSFTKVAAGYRHACGLTTTQEIYCAGLNNEGELGSGDDVDRNVPVKFGPSLVKTYTQLSAGAEATCAVTTDQQVYCAGDNENGELGDGTTTERLNPVRFGNLAGATFLSKTFKQVSSGGQGGSTNHTCALSKEKKKKSAGANGKNQLGYSASTSDQLNPVLFGGTVAPTIGKTYLQVSAGSAYTCGVGVDKIIYCSGNNDEGQQGVGTTTDRTYPDISMMLI